MAVDFFVPAARKKVGPILGIYFRFLGWGCMWGWLIMMDMRSTVVLEGTAIPGPPHGRRGHVSERLCLVAGGGAVIRAHGPQLPAFRQHGHGQKQHGSVPARTGGWSSLTMLQRTLAAHLASGQGVAAYVEPEANNCHGLRIGSGCESGAGDSGSRKRAPASGSALEMASSRQLLDIPT
jgi:hypothetical protein